MINKFLQYIIIFIINVPIVWPRKVVLWRRKVAVNFDPGFLLLIRVLYELLILFVGFLTKMTALGTFFIQPLMMLASCEKRERKKKTCVMSNKR